MTPSMGCFGHGCGHVSIRHAPRCGKRAQASPKFVVKSETNAFCVSPSIYLSIYLAIFLYRLVIIYLCIIVYLCLPPYLAVGVHTRRIHVSTFKDTVDQTPPWRPRPPNAAQIPRCSEIAAWQGVNEKRCCQRAISQRLEQELKQDRNCLVLLGGVAWV